MRTALTAVVVALLVVSVTGCHGDRTDKPAPAPFDPVLEDTKCPPEVDDVLMSGYSCQFLSVAEGIKLLVTKVEPTSGTSADDPLIVVGADFGHVFNYAGIAPVADRLGRTVYFLNPRGVAGSQPDLSCPEVDALADSSLAAGGDDAARTAWLSAVQQCHQRLMDGGVDLASFGSDAMTGDVLALVRMLGLDSWSIGDWGTSSVVTLRLLAEDPPGLRAVFLDSPAVPDDDPRATMDGDTRRALGALLDDCAADPACEGLPDSLDDLDAAVTALDKAPLERTLDQADGPVTVRLDGTTLMRLVRHSLAINGAVQYFTPGAVPAILAGASRWTKQMDDALLEPLTASAPYCEGYLPTTCASFQRATLGVVLTDLCRNHDPGAVPSAGDDAISRYAATSPYAAACASWPVEPNDDAALPELTSKVPVLAFVGEYDPFTDADRVRAAFAAMPNAHVVDVPGWGHNAIAADPCLGDIRKAFFDNPTAALQDGCLKGVRPVPEFLPHL